MKKENHITLPDDPIEALHVISSFINKNMELKGHRYPDGADKKSFVGYWQDVNFFYNLKAIAHYAGEY